MVNPDGSEQRGGAAGFRAEEPPRPCAGVARMLSGPVRPFTHGGAAAASGVGNRRANNAFILISP